MSKQTDNANLTGKLILRQYFLEQYHKDGAHVLDCCQGSAKIWGTLNRDFPPASYLGLDLKPQKGRLVIDSVKYLENPGWRHDCIDVDTYGAPWKHWLAILKNAQTDCTVFLTIGKVGGLNNMQTAAKEKLGIPTKTPISILSKLSKFSVDYLLGICYHYGMIPVDAQEAQSTANAQYIGVRLTRE